MVLFTNEANIKFNQSSQLRQAKVLLVSRTAKHQKQLQTVLSTRYHVLTANLATVPEILLKHSDLGVILVETDLASSSDRHWLKLITLEYNLVTVVISSTDSLQHCQTALAEGIIFRYLTKPLSVAKLLEVVQNAVDTSSYFQVRNRHLYHTQRIQTLHNHITQTIVHAPSRNGTVASLAEVCQTIIKTIGQTLKAHISVLRLTTDKAKTYFYCPSIASPQEEILAATVCETTQTIIINVEPQQYPQPIDSPSQVAAYQQLEIQTSVIVPILWQQQTLGIIGLHHCHQPYFWQEEEIQLIIMIAEQAASAIASAISYEQVQALAQRQTMINNITSAIRSSLEPQIIFSTITKQLGEALQVDGCALSLWTKDDQYVRCVGLYDRHSPTDMAQLPESSTPIADNPLQQQLLDTFKPVVIDDAQLHPPVNQDELPLRSPARALLIVPLIVEAKIIGSISLRQADQSRDWQPAEIELAEVVAAQAAIAVKQGKLYDKLKQLNSYLTESLLQRFLPAAIVEKAANGELKLDLSPEPRLVTILFSDIVDFTQLSSQLGASRIALLLNEYLEAMTKVVFDYGGTVDKFIGDALLALFGAPEELTAAEQAKRAVNVSRSMHLRLAQLNQSWQMRGILGQDISHTQLQFRCGIHQGNAVVGMFGSSQRSDYTAIGPAVNIAARLQQAAMPNTIVVSDIVAQYLDSDQLTAFVCPKLKGVEEKIATYLVEI